MGLIRLGALWEKAFKNGNGFAGQLDAEEVENILNADPQVDKIRVLVFDNAKGLEKNENAPHFVIYAPDGEDDGRGGGGARGAQSSRREPEPEPAEEPSNPLDAPPPAALVRRRSAAPARTQASPPPAPARGNGRRSTGGAGKRGEECGFGRVEFPGMLAEEGLGRGLDAVGVGPVGDLV